jgi:AcrR family transcriptional regulator
MNRGERTANKTKSAIKNALLELIHTKNYPNITVSEITQKANVGRSTFYKHYQSKADTLVDIHVDMFKHLINGLITSGAGGVQEPPPELIEFLKASSGKERYPLLLSYKLGSDLDYLINHLNLQFTAIIEKKLCHFFNDNDDSIPLSILAQSISYLFCGLIISWFTKSQSADARQFASNLYRLIKALIFEVTGKGNSF